MGAGKSHFLPKGRGRKDSPVIRVQAWDAGDKGSTPCSTTGFLFNLSEGYNLYVRPTPVGGKDKLEDPRFSSNRR